MRERNLSSELLRPSILEERPESVARFADGTVVLIVVFTIVENELDVVEEVVAFRVLMRAHLLFHRGEVHGRLDAFVILGMLLGVHGSLERPRRFVLQQLVEDVSAESKSCDDAGRQRGLTCKL